MRKGHWVAAALMLGLVGAAAPVAAEVTAQTEAGFVIKHSAEVPAGQAEVWAALVAPAKWWSSEHTWSHDAANLYLDAQATGCFCEKLPKPAGATYEKFASLHRIDTGRAAMFEDLPRNLKVPKALGMRTVLLVPRNLDAVLLERWEQPTAEDDHIDYVTDDLAEFLTGIGPS